jgi:hypothetical protein
VKPKLYLYIDSTSTHCSHKIVAGLADPPLKLTVSPFRTEKHACHKVLEYPGNDYKIKLGGSLLNGIEYTD